MLCATATTAHAQKREIKRSDFGDYVALWRLSHDPATEDQADYHMQQVWSPDGRYLVYTHREIVPAPQGGVANAGRGRPMIHVYDFLKDENRPLGLGIMQGFGPVWANRHNWLFYVQTTEQDRGFAAPQGSPVMWADFDSGTTVEIGKGMDQLGGVDCNDEYVYGGIKDTSRKPAFRTARVRISRDGGATELPNVTGFQFVPNPRFPVLLMREDRPGEFFKQAYWFYDLDGKNQRAAEIMIEAAHTAWQGSGEHVILGDGPCRGRRHDEPYPGNLHLLSAGSGGNISACGRSGRFLVGDSSLFDLRSGDSWQYKYFLSPRLKPSKGPFASFEGEAKGSPDGTKVSFTVCYDMEKGPVTELAETLRPGNDRITVKSTRDFPPSGAIVIWWEVIGYQRKTATSFEGLTRNLHGTPGHSGAPAGTAVTDFRYHLLTEREAQSVRALPTDIRLDIKDASSPLIRQRRAGLHVMVVRRPDRPCLRSTPAGIELIPGESHDETQGYHLLEGGRRITEKVLRPGTSFKIDKPGNYQAIAVEWSGLQGDSSFPLKISQNTSLEILKDPPQDFSWTSQRHLVGSAQVTPEKAMRADQSIRETVHLYDGIIAREWLQKGSIGQRHDLNREGKAIRRMTFEGGKLASREYFNRQDQRVSREIVDGEGWITQRIRFDAQQREVDHWWLEKGVPVRRVLGQQAWRREGDQWISGRGQ